MPVEVVAVELATIGRSATVAGQLEPLRAVAVNAQLAGPLVRVQVEEGDRVRAGDLLAELDSRELAAQVRSAEATLRFAQTTAERSTTLFRDRIVTAAEYERDRATLESAEATLDQLRTRLGFARIVSPIDGVVTERRVQAGDVVGTQARLFTVADLGTLVARLQVSELDVPFLEVGAPVAVSVDALGGARVDGRIRRVFPAVDSASRLVPVEVAFTGSATRSLRPGNTIRATFSLDSRSDALVVPTRALVGAGAARSVFLVRDGTALRRNVRSGPDIEGRSQIFEGVALGDSVVTAGAATLRDGAKVRIVPPLVGDTTTVATQRVP
jgi:RND family efflux transporter MFP subunit